VSDSTVGADEAAERRRRLAAVGDVVADASGDEPGRGWSEHQDLRDRDDEILSDVPPHHG
jgi:hypothetical protein